MSSQRPARGLSLSAKLILCLVSTLIVVEGLAGYLRYRMHQQDLEQSVIASAHRINDVIRRSMHHSMLRNQRDDIYRIITTIAAEPGLTKIRIYNEEGRITFSSDATEVNTFVDKAAEACLNCHSGATPTRELRYGDHARIFRTETSSRVLGVINPIENAPDCSSADCHAHAPATRFLGVLDTQMSLESVDRQMAASSREFFLTLAVSLLTISLIAGLFIWMLVYKPVRMLTAATHRLAEGDLEHIIETGSSDEIGALSHSFNQMTAELREARQQLTEWAQTLEKRVEQKTEELRRAHEHTLEAERMASVGKLAAIVAHEINNPLAGIRTYANLLAKRLDRQGHIAAGDTDVKEALSLIESESCRCGDIVKNLLQYSRPSEQEKRPENLNTIIKQSVRLVQHQIQVQGLKLALELNETIVPITCHSQEIKQALLALLINACEAMPDGGHLTVRSSWNRESRRAEIQIQDDGVGIDEERQVEVFEPFFTTKDSGDGLGLGLAVVKSIINKHNGTIRVDSRPGEGTTFTLTLPEHPPEQQEKVGPEVGLMA